MERRTLTVLEIAEYLGVCVDTVYTMVKEKQIPYIRVRRRILFSAEAIDQWIRDQEKRSLMYE
ncbi:helix-turn-helix domain-containing protein [Fictibacillus nanhaiensis]|uniref:helix-turn-helix domain-containing protein n=1 Tax=Fictibacillus nanhaiensis TaxID=742169 RepID=UPI002E2237FD|nr:helix-turn-helix domain-containing protein [Fictibacillus nanhaiensis]